MDQRDDYADEPLQQKRASPLLKFAADLERFVRPRRGSGTPSLVHVGTACGPCRWAGNEVRGEHVIVIQPAGKTPPLALKLTSRCPSCGRTGVVVFSIPPPAESPDEYRRPR